MSIEEFKLFANIAVGSVLIPFAIGIINYKRLSDEMKLLLVLTGVSFFCDLLGFWSPTLKLNANYAGSFYLLSEFFLLLSIFYRTLDAKKYRWLFILLGVSFFVFIVFNIFYFQKGSISSYAGIIASLVFIVFPVIYFYRLMVDLPALRLTQLPMFWVSVAVLVYFSGNLLLFTLSEYLIQTLKKDFIVYWTFHNCLSLTRNIFFAIAFYVSFRTEESRVL